MAGGKAVAEKKPTSTGGKAPASKSACLGWFMGNKVRALTSSSIVATEGSAKKSVGAKKSAAPAADGEKKKRKKTRKETYSSYIYKGIAVSSNPS